MANNLLQKAKSAISSGEWVKAKEILESALHFEEAPEIYEELAWAYWWLNEYSNVFKYRLKAFDLFLEKDDKHGASRTARWIGLDYIEFKGEYAIASGWFKRAETLLKGLPDSIELGFIKILKARWAFQVEKNNELAFKYLKESAELSRKFKSIEGEMLTEALKGFILVCEGNILEGMPLLDEATLLAVTNKQSDVNIVTITCCYLIDACERVRDYERASQWCNTVKEICKQWQYKAMFANCRMKYAGILIRKGEWVEAEAELVKASDELAEFRPIQVNACTVRLADLKRRQGKWQKAEELLDLVKNHPLNLFYSAKLYYDKGEYEKSINAASKFLRRIPVHEKAERIPGVEFLIKAYSKLDMKEDTKNMLEELKDISISIDTIPVKSALLSCFGHYYKMIKDFEKSLKFFEDAIDLYDELGLTFESSRNRLLLAEIHAYLGNSVQAEAELNAALNGFKKLGAEKDFEKAKRLLKNIHRNVRDSFQDSLELTGRELEVLRHIARGENNEKIAGKLYLSVRTIEKHITNIYSKMGVTGKSARAYAASYAIKNNLV